MKTPLWILPLVLSLPLAIPAEAQSGPFRDGELILDTPISNPRRMWRIDPVSGTATELVQNYSGGGQPGWMVYDPYRGGLLVSATFWALGPVPRLVRVDAGGSLSDLGFGNEYLRALSAVGDGRVYFQRYDIAGPQAIEVLDASNQVHVLTHQGSGLPVDQWADYSFYSPETNSLIVAAYIPGGGCSSGWVHVYRLPLTPDGLQVSGAITCASWDFPFQGEYLNGIDRLPGGKLLMAVSHDFVGDQTLVEIDPTGPTLSLWAETTQADFSGVVWSTRLGRAVLVDDYFNKLRLFDAGHQSGPGIWGDELVTTLSVPIGGGSAFANNITLVDVNLLGSGCSGLALSYGQGLAGHGGAVPALGVSSCPKIGAPLTISVSNGRGGASGFLFGGVNPASIPVKGGTLWVGPPYAKLLFTLGGTSGGIGAGSIQLNANYPNNPALMGVPFYCQAALLDSGAVMGLSMTNALELRAE